MSEKALEKPRKRNVWSSTEVIFFLSLIKEKQVLGLMDGKRLRVGDIFKTLVGPMRDNGYIRDASQLIIKYKNLKAEYYKARRHNNVSGNSPYMFEFYDQMNEILGDRPLSQASSSSQVGFDSIADVPVLDEIDPNQLNLLNVEIELYDDAPDVDGAIPGCSKEQGIKKLSGHTVPSPSTRSQNISPIPPAGLQNTPHTAPLAAPQNTPPTTLSGTQMTPKMTYKRRKVKQGPSELEEFLKRSEENRKKELEAEKEMLANFFEQQREMMRESASFFVQGLKEIFRDSKKDNDSDSD